MPAQEKSACKITRKDMGVHHVVFQKGGLPDGTVLGYCVQKKIFLEGYKKGNGIVCGCCDSEVSASNFEVHAGFARHRKPYHHIFTSNGVSLHEFAVYLLQEPTVLKEKSDLLCTKCSKGGKLMCCDMCPRAFHLGCCIQSSNPEFSCNSTKLLTYYFPIGATASGRVPRVYLMQQITERHIRIFEMVEDGVACALCRYACDYSKSGFDPRTIIICDQDCFEPIKDESGEDRIPLMVYGYIHMFFFYCSSVVVSTVTLRVYGDIAELPLVATPKEYQGQVLFSCIEKLLACLKVEKMVLPSAETSISIWTKKFGFKEIEEQEFERLKKKHYHLITFEETTMLERGVPGLKELDSNPFNSLKLT
ncbi:hypothetical protein QQ045_016414 [Rhodiola kirilowii]